MQNYISIFDYNLFFKSSESLKFEIFQIEDVKLNILYSQITTLYLCIQHYGRGGKTRWKKERRCHDQVTRLI